MKDGWVTNKYYLHQKYEHQRKSERISGLYVWAVLPFSVASGFSVGMYSLGVRIDIIFWLKVSLTLMGALFVYEFITTPPAIHVYYPQEGGKVGAEV